ncbi:protein yellow-like [Cloeon dipterum]|uniref:protein yellow-like n=1 Tax=Cloeon dipterum TaxID=197152 RepID=UPI00321FF643
MNWPCLIIVTVVLGLSVASALSFTQVYEWSETEFFGDAKNAKDAAGPIVPSSMVVYGDRIFFGFPNSSSRGLPRLTYAWLPCRNNADNHLSTPLYRLQRDKIGANCDAVQGVIDLKTDELGRLWVLDGGSRNCPPTFRIFDLKNNDSLVQVHPLARNPRNIINVMSVDVLNDTFSLVSEWSGEFFVFALKANKTRTIDRKNGPFSKGQGGVKDAAWMIVSPLNNLLGYACSFQCREIFFVDDTKKPISVTPIGTLSSYSKGMLMDKNGVLYFVHEKEKCVTAWDTKIPFNEEMLHKFEPDVDSIIYALDGADNLWLLSHDASSRFFLHRGSNSTDFTNATN